MRVASLFIGTEAFLLAIRHRQGDDRPFNPTTPHRKQVDYHDNRG